MAPGLVTVAPVADGAHEVLRRFARDQAVRERGTPRITVLIGGDEARRLWIEWKDLMRLDASLLDGAIDTSIANAMKLIARDPAACVAVLASAKDLAAWQKGRRDRASAMIEEGQLVIPEPPAKKPRVAVDAKSVAEARLFDALERDRSTIGLFEGNAKMSFRFGNKAAEVDLLARSLMIAVEIDGFYHFTEIDRWKSDRRKDILLQGHGYFVVRVHADDITRDPRDAVQAIKQVIASQKKGKKR